MVEVVVFHDLAEVGKEDSKQLEWIKTETFTITYLEDDGKTIAAAVPTNNQATQQSQEENISIDDDVNVDFRINYVDEEQQDIQKDEGEYSISNKLRNDQSGVIILNRRFNQKTDEVNRLTKPSSISSDDGLKQYESNSSNEACNQVIKLPHTTCEFCLKDFPTLVHKRRHKRKRHFYCVHCNKQYRDAVSIQQHPCALQDRLNSSNVIHKNKNNSAGGRRKIVRTAVEKSPAVLIKNLSTVGGTFYPSTSDSEPKPYVKTTPQCPICGKIFRGNYMLKRHEVIHTGEKPFKCDQCCRAFTQIAGLNRHKKELHLTQKSSIEGIRNIKYRNYECQICYKVFKNLQYLKLHKLAHHGEYSKNGDGDGATSNGSDSPSSSSSSSSLTSQEISHDYRDTSCQNDNSIPDEVLRIDDEEECEKNVSLIGI